MDSSGDGGRGDKGSRKRKIEDTPRSRKRHHLSDGESDSEDPSVLYRALRPEEDPEREGLQPPEGFDPDITHRQHITSGTGAKIKSPWISFSRSKKVAASWSTEKGGTGRIVKTRRPKDRTAFPSFDLTNREEAREVFPALKGSSYNTALASQEVVVKGPIPKDELSELEILQTRRVKVGEYQQATVGSPPELVAKIRSRTKTSSTVWPVLLFHPPGKKQD